MFSMLAAADLLNMGKGQITDKFYKLMQIDTLTLLQIQMLSDASVADYFWKNCDYKGEIAHNQFLLLPQCFHLYSKFILSFIKVHIFLSKCFQAADFWFVGKG